MEGGCTVIFCCPLLLCFLAGPEIQSFFMLAVCHFRIHSFFRKSWQFTHCTKKFIFPIHTFYYHASHFFTHLLLLLPLIELLVQHGIPNTKTISVVYHYVAELVLHLGFQHPFSCGVSMRKGYSRSTRLEPPTPIHAENNCHFTQEHYKLE